MNDASRLVSTIGLAMPPDFAAAPYDAVHSRVRDQRHRNPAAWDEYAGGWNAIAHRFLACANHDEVFTASVKSSGNAPGSWERHLQERELFGFFVTGLSALESFAYGVNAVAALIDARRFPIEPPNAITIEKVRTRFRQALPGEAVLVTLECLLDLAEYGDWREARNVLAHRAQPGRHVFAGGEQDGQVVWRLSNILIDATTTTSRRRWLASTLWSLLHAADSFTARHFTVAAG